MQAAPFQAFSSAFFGKKNKITAEQQIEILDAFFRTVTTS